MSPYQSGPGPHQDPNGGWSTGAPAEVPLPRTPTWSETAGSWATTDPYRIPPPWPQQPTLLPPHQPADPRPPKRGGNTALIVAVVVVVLLAVGGAGWFVWDRLSAESTDSTAQAAGPSIVPAPSAGKNLSPAPQSSSAPADRPSASTSMSPPTAASPSTAAPPPAADAEQQALAQLDALRQESLARAPLDGRWVAQVASKSVGITDPLQTAANGTHTFFAVDILAEIRVVQATVGGSANVHVLWGTDFGRRSVAADGAPYWTTLAEGGFGGEDDVEAWCAATYPGLSPDQLTNQCAPRRLTPPHD